MTADGPLLEVLRPLALEAKEISKRFQRTQALDDVSIGVPAGQIHALLGPNGAGKTTLLRVLSGLVTPDSGSITILGRERTGAAGRAIRGAIGLVPAGDRTFYLRISGLENLVFFARLHGLRRREARRRALRALEDVGLADAASRPVGRYSHGMQKRLAVARGLLTEPTVMLVDEATHDLDPEGAHRVRGLIEELVARGTAVVWATQRLDEIRGFAHGVTVLSRGRVVFAGTEPELVARAIPRTFVLGLQADADRRELVRRARHIVAGLAAVASVGDGESGAMVLRLREGAVLGDAIARLAAAGVAVVSAREERSAVEDVFLSLTAEDAAG